MSKLSIITINYNNALGLERTIKSVLSQKISSLEFLVIDGNSTDGSQDIIKKYIDNLTFTCSENDEGIYDAMNKGIQKASGDYLLFLNSGDYFFSDHVLKDNRHNLNTYDVIAFDIQMLGLGDPFIVRPPDKINFSYLYEKTLAHQAVFIKRSLFNRVGLYDKNLKIVADWKFFIDAFTKFDATYHAIHKTLSIYCLDGISATGKGSIIRKQERRATLNSEYKLFIDDYKQLNLMKSNRFKILEVLETSKIAQKLNSFWLRLLLFLIKGKRIAQLTKKD